MGRTRWRKGEILDAELRVQDHTGRTRPTSYQLTSSGPVTKALKKVILGLWLVGLIALAGVVLAVVLLILVASK